MTSRSLRAARPRLDLGPSQDPAPRSARIPAATLDDSQLLAASRAGDPEAATAIHDRLRPVVERAICRLLGPRDQHLEDLAQHAMIEVCFTIHRYRGDCPLGAWASTVAAHVVYNHLRRRTFERRLFEAFPAGDDDALPSAHRLSRDASARSTLRRVVTHLDAMDPVKSWTYVLHDVYGYELREVAEITEATISAAQTRLVRGRRELRQRIAADSELASLMSARSRARVVQFRKDPLLQRASRHEENG